MKPKDFIKKPISILDSNWGIGNRLKEPLIKLLQNRVNKKISRLRIPCSRIFPRSASIETSTICNSECIFCPHGTGALTRKREIMSNDLFFKIMDICKKENINIISFGGVGEFLCDKDFLAKARYISDNDLILDGLTTNGMLLSGKISENLINLGLRRLIISIDAAGKAKYEKIRKGLSFEQVMKNTLYFLDLNSKNGCKTSVTINTTVYKDNTKEKPRIIAAFKKYFGSNFKLTFYPVRNWGQDLPDRGKRLKSYCYRIFSPSVLIRVDGSVSLCCQDYNNKYSLGPIGDSIENLWNSPKIIDIRKRHLDGKWNDIDICRSCSDIILCKPPIEEVK